MKETAAIRYIPTPPTHISYYYTCRVSSSHLTMIGKVCASVRKEIEEVSCVIGNTMKNGVDGPGVGCGKPRQFAISRRRFHTEIIQNGEKIFDVIE